MSQHVPKIIAFSSFLAFVVIILSLGTWYNVLPSPQNITITPLQNAEGPPVVIALPYRNAKPMLPTGLYRVNATLPHYNFSSDIYHVTPDDCIDEMHINGVNISLVDIEGICDWQRGFSIDLGAYLKSGSNQMELLLRNTGGPYAIDIYPTFLPIIKALIYSIILCAGLGIFYLSIQQTDILTSFFTGALIARFCFPFWLNPMRDISNDWGRHWENGTHLLHPVFMGGVDPKLYQLWIFIIHVISGDKPSIIAVFTGLLCALMPYVWYRAAREVFTRNTALALGIIIAIHPSFIMIYSFFMNETLLLVILGLSFWAGLRTLRKKTLTAFLWAVAAAILAILTRFVALPMALMLVAYSLYYQPKKLKNISYSALIGIVLLLPPALYTYQAIHIFTPLQYTTPVEIYYKSNMITYGFTILGKGQYGWGSPSFYSDILEPLYHYKSARGTVPYHAVIDLQKGRNDWDLALRKLNEHYNYHLLFRDMGENILFFFFGPSWPDSAQNGEFLSVWNWHSRWMWAPLMTIILLVGPWIKTYKNQLFILFSTWIMIILMMVQHSGVMEGRYRKPLEPLILFSITVIIQSVRRKTILEKEYNFYGFLKELSLPVWHYFNQKLKNSWKFDRGLTGV